MAISGNCGCKTGSNGSSGNGGGQQMVIMPGCGKCGCDDTTPTPTPDPTPPHQKPPTLPAPPPGSGFGGGSTPPQRGNGDPTPPGSGSGGAAQGGDTQATFDCQVLITRPPGSDSATYTNVDILPAIKSGAAAAGFFDDATEVIEAANLSLEAFVYAGVPNPINTEQPITGTLTPAYVISNRGSFDAGDNSQQTYYFPYTSETGWVGIFPVLFRKYNGSTWLSTYDNVNNQYKSVEFNGSFPKAPGGAGPGANATTSDTAWLNLTCCGVTKKRKPKVCTELDIDELITEDCWSKGINGNLTWDEHMGGHDVSENDQYIIRQFKNILNTTSDGVNCEITVLQEGEVYYDFQFFMYDITNPDMPVVVANTFLNAVRGNVTGEEPIDFFATFSTPTGHLELNHIYKIAIRTGGRVKAIHAVISGN